MTTRLRVAVCLAVLTSAGCGVRTTTVAGRVSFQGKPVVYGTVALIGSDGIPRSGTIGPGGNYQIPGVPLGTAKVAVTSLAPPGAEPLSKGGSRAAPGEDQDKKPPAVAAVDPEVIKKWFAIPFKYADPKTSGLTFEVTSGQPYDLDLK